MLWHRNAVALVAIVFASGFLTAQTPIPITTPKPKQITAGEDEARALLLLAKASREREDSKAVALCASGKCFENKLEAERASKLKGSPIIFWVGMKCVDNPGIREKLEDFIHCHLATWNGSPEPRLVFTDRENRDWTIGKAELDQDSPQEIREVLKLPQLPKK
jgi:hypothetical protein